MKTEKRSVGTIEIRSNDDGTPIEFSGYAAKFYNPADTGTEFQLGSRMFERIASTAFSTYKTDDIRGLFNHDSNIVLGRTTAGTMFVDVDGVGLRYRIPFDTNDPDHQRVAAKLKRGDVTGSSFQFAVRSSGSQWSTEIRNGEKVEIRTLTDVELFDVGPVTFPAYSSATSGVRTKCKDDPAWLEYQQRMEEEKEQRLKQMKMEIQIREKCGKL